MKKKVAVLGTGTAGVMNIAHYLLAFPEDWEIYSVHDPNNPILGIGESTSTQIPEILFDATGFNLLEHSHELDATVKFGVKFKGWRKKEFYSVINPKSNGIHFNNFRLKEFAFSKFKERWPNRFKEIHDHVIDITQKPEWIKIEGEYKSYAFDYVVDCRGYPTDYEDYDDAFINVNRCLVHTVNKPGDWDYTCHQATPDGWMFGIPLQTRQGWGYLFNDNITSVDEAKENMKVMLNTDKLDLREFKFNSYRAKKYIDGRLIKNGNRAIFYEPMEAHSGFFYDKIARTFVDYAQGYVDESTANNVLTRSAIDMENAICFMYQGGSTYNTEFWNWASTRSKEKLDNDIIWKQTLAELKEIQKDFPTGTISDGAGTYSLYHWMHFSKHLGYDYF
jgi:hypothetical protein